MQNIFHSALQYYQQGKLAKAQKLCQQYIKQQPKDVSGLHLLSLIFIQTEAYEQAIPLLQRAVDLHPQAQLYEHLGYVYAKLARYIQAIEVYKKSLLLDQKHYDTYPNLLSILEKLGRYEEAEAVCHAALKIKPDDHQILLRLGVTLHKLKKYSEAETVLTQVCTAKPQNIAPYLALAKTLISQKLSEKYASAEALLRQALEIQPSAVIYQQLGTLKLYQLEYTQAIDCFKRLIELKKDDYGAHYYIGTCLYRMGNTAEAMSYFAQTFQLIQPMIAVETNFLTRVNLLFASASALIYQNLLKEADKILIQITPILENNAEHRALDNFRLVKCTKFDEIFYHQLKNSQLTQPYTQLLSSCQSSYDHVVLISCDTNYFTQYGKPYINSYAENANINSLLHIHFINPQKNIIEQVQQLLVQRAIGNFTITAEYIELDQVNLISYCTLARFLHLSVWSQQYQKPIICTDIDAILEKPLSILCHYVEGNDLGMRSRLVASWEKFMANVIVVQPTEYAIRYFSLVNAYLMYWVERNQLYWGIDELALTAVYKLLQYYENYSVNIKLIDNKWEEIIWLLGHRNIAFLESERFLKYA